MENIKEMLKAKNETVLTEMFYQVYDEYFAGRPNYVFNPHKHEICMFRSDKPKTARTFYRIFRTDGCEVYIFNEKLTPKEIKKFMIDILTSESVNDWRRNGRKHSKEITRVATEMGTTKEDIMSVFKINLEERK